MIAYSRVFSEMAKNICKSLRRRRFSLTAKELEDKRRELINKIDSIPLENVRNFSIIAHVDHGKSTLADRILEMTGALTVDPTNKQVLDKLQVERERGITVKAQTASLVYNYKGEEYLLNLIDTPGHVDFSNEVSRSLAACQGVVLLVDANQGVQAQTVANFYLAFTQELAILPVLNKVDLKNANPELVAEQLHNLFSIKPDDIIKISAKMGTNVDQVLKAIIERLPHPPVDRHAKLQALLFDSWYDKYRGALGLVYVHNGKIKVGDEVKWCQSKSEYVVKSLGILSPDEESVTMLQAGHVGVIGCNMRSTAEALIGATLVHVDDSAEPLAGFSQAKPMVFAGIYPFSQTEHVALASALEKLTLNDNAVTIKQDSSAALGQGWRLGFLGLLHMEVFTQRLEQEYNVEAILTSPSVTYKVKIIGKKNIENYGKEELLISNPALLPASQIISEMQEPVVLGTIVTPDTYLGDIISLCMEKRGIQQHATNIDNSRVLIQFILPLNEIIADFHDRLKSVSSGFASFDYEDRGYVPSSLAKVEILLNGNPVEEFSSIVHVSKSGTFGRKLCKKLVEVIPRQQFKIIIQAKVGGAIVGREEVKPFRKDVSAKLGGKRVGDMSRLKKLLKQQAEGKKKMKMVGNIALPRETFIEALKR